MTSGWKCREFRQRLLETRCDGQQHRVADGVAKRIVDALEVVQVEVNDRDGLARALGRVEHRAEQIDATPPVRQPRQRVVVSEPLDVLRCGRIAQDVLEPVRQQRPIHGLRDEVRRAGIERAANGRGILMPRDDHDRHGAQSCVGAQPPAHLVAVEHGHVHVEQHDRHVVLARRGERRAAVGERKALEPSRGDGLLEQHAAEILVVGDDRDSFRRHDCAHAVARRRWPCSASSSAACVAQSSSHAARAGLRLTREGVPLELLDSLRVRERADIAGRRCELVAEGRGRRKIVTLERRPELAQGLRGARAEQPHEPRIEIGLLAGAELLECRNGVRIEGRQRRLRARTARGGTAERRQRAPSGRATHCRSKRPQSESV